jgi:transcriptional regulator with XRE-family HTH domain
MDTIYDPDYISLIDVLKSIREERGLTQAQLGERLGRDQTFVSKYESRERRLDVLELRNICNALDASFLEVISGLITPPPPSSNSVGDVVEEVQAAVVDTFSSYPQFDAEWSHTDWRSLIDWFVGSGILNYKEIGSLMLGHLNPSQVGTSIASKKTFQSRFPPRKVWQAVRQWHFEQSGRCLDCGTRLELQADHIVPREQLGDDADRLENMTLRCRRCNVIRRPSHKLGGQTFLTTEAALMWILFVKRPKTYQAFERLCREYGLTMANIRFQEAWAMARWLAADGLYEIDADSLL